jgi:hypothetical protein
VQCRRLRHVLEDLDAGHEVVVIGQGIRDSANLAIGAQVGPNARNRKVRDIAAISFHAAVPKRLDKKTKRAPGIKHAGWTYGPDQLVGSLCKEFEPVSTAFIGKWSAMRGVILRAVQLCRGGTDRDEATNMLIHTITRNPTSYVFTATLDGTCLGRTAVALVSYQRCVCQSAYSCNCARNDFVHGDSRRYLPRVFGCRAQVIPSMS